MFQNIQATQDVTLKDALNFDAAVAEAVRILYHCQSENPVIATYGRRRYSEWYVDQPAVVKIAALDIFERGGRAA
jgi:hypothetical protein